MDVLVSEFEWQEEIITGNKEEAVFSIVIAQGREGLVC